MPKALEVQKGREIRITDVPENVHELIEKYKAKRLLKDGQRLTKPLACIELIKKGYSMS